MSAQHGQNYDPDEEPQPRGGWFVSVERPFPERLDRFMRGLAAAIGWMTAIGFAVGLPLISTKAPEGVAYFAALAALVITGAAMAYGFARGLGMIVVGIYGTLREGSEIVVDPRAMVHDLRLRQTWVLLLEAALLLATMGGMVWGMAEFVRHGSWYGLAMFGLLVLMTFWPLVRHRIRRGVWPD